MTCSMIKSDMPYLPETPWIYQFKRKNWVVLYIGKAKNLSKRVQQYFSPGSVRKQDMVYMADQIEYISTESEEKALLLEEEMIKQYLPDYNRLLKHNSNYVYIKISDHEFPKVEIVRKKRNDKSTYVGPKQRSKMLYTLLKYLRRIYKWRTMSHTQFKKWIIDMDFHLGLDEGWSIIQYLGTELGDTQAKKYEIDTSITKQEYQKMYTQRLIKLASILNGETSSTLQTIQEEIQKHTKNQNYERCAQLRDIYAYIQNWDESNQHLALWSERTWTIAHLINTETDIIIVICKIFEGKIIDILRESYALQERELSEISASLTKEFGVAVRSQDKWLTVLSTKGRTRLPKKEKETIHTFISQACKNYIESKAFDKNSVMSGLLEQLQEKYKLKSLPYHIECLDISHLGGEHTSAWLACYINGLPQKRGYRHYKIQHTSWNDDYKSLEETLVRRFGISKKEIRGENLPHLFVLDGWKWQLWIMHKIYKQYPIFKEFIKNSDIDIVALWKGKARKSSGRKEWYQEKIYYLDTQDEIQEIPLNYDQSDRILIWIRDESHRFANRYRKKRMSKQITQR